MPRAIWNGVVVAESDRCVTVEGNQYFPPDSIKPEYLQPSDTRTTCPWKGVAHYCNLVFEGKVSKDAAWYYPETKDAADQIRGHYAFWRDVTIEA